MKNILLAFISIFIFSSLLFSQADYVPADHPVYQFLERLNSRQIINYNSLEIPKTRKEVAGFLSEAIYNKKDLSGVDNRTLQLYAIEFEYELSGTKENIGSLLSEGKYNLFDDSQRYLFSLVEGNMSLRGSTDTIGTTAAISDLTNKQAAIFINFIAESHSLYSGQKDIDDYTSYNKFGGIIRGTLLNKFGFYIKGTNGKVFGSKPLSKRFNEVKYSLKANASSEDLHDMVDFTEGYFTADFDLIKFKLGRDVKHIGYGNHKSFLSSNAPIFDYVSLDMKYKMFSFSYFHGQLLGTETNISDSIQGGIKTITDKYTVYHRLGLDIFKNTNLGVGEITVYSNRNPDLSYINPFSFHKSIEHANRDRDNSMLFVDLRNNSIKGLTLSGSFLLDEMIFGRLGTDWWANKFVYDLSVYSSNLYKIVPVDISLQYLRINSYTFTHRIHNNNYSNYGQSLIAPLQPNSHLAALRFIFFPHYKLKVNAGFDLIEHGANPLNTDGSLKENVGGNVLVGHRPFDSETAKFLAGDKEVMRKYLLQISYQPFLRYYVNLELNYIDEKLQGREKENYFLGGLSVSLLF